jgi:hypothetical protein
LGRAPFDASAYYADAAVQERIREYCGASVRRAPTCTWISQLVPEGFATWEATPRHRADALPALFARGWDISRSLLDVRSLLVHVELDYMNPAAPADALLWPDRVFAAMEPIYRVVCGELRRLDLPLLDVMTGRGYHFTGRVPLSSVVVARLSALGDGTGRRRELAHRGFGLLAEYLAHRVLQLAAPSALPIVLNGTEVGAGGAGREAISIDLSEYGDPVGVRQLRVAFGTYQSHRIRPDVFGAPAAESVPILVAVPRRGRPLSWMLEHARSTRQAAALARTESAAVPIVTTGVGNLLTEYESSELRRFHRDFRAITPHAPAAWADTYDRIEEGGLPPCVGTSIRHPNDALLKPTVLQHVTRFLMAEGWHPRHIAGLVWSKYAREYAWGERWHRLDPAARAEFDVRVFSGLVAMRLDEAVDFNCVSAQEKGLCPGISCTHDLRVDRRRLLRQVAL